MIVNAKALLIDEVGNGGTSEVERAAGFLMIGPSRSKAIAPGFSVQILIFVVHALFGFVARVTGKRPVSCGIGSVKGHNINEEALPSSD